MMNKKDIVQSLETIAVYMEIKGENSFKVSAYRRAAQVLESDERSMKEIGNAAELKGIGEATAEVIRELVDTGRSTLLETVKQEIPAGLIPLLQLPGLGGKKIAKLYQELGVTDWQSLKKACQDHSVQSLSGFGKKTEENMLAAIADFGTRPERLPIATMLKVADDIDRQLSCISMIERFSRAGSLRRLRENMKDVDYVIATTEADKVSRALLELEGISEIIAKGETKVTIELAYSYAVQVDFRLVEPEAFAVALHHFTGSKDHNVKMRQLAKQQGEKINEYGIEIASTGDVLTFSSETAFYEHFQLRYIPPELREGGEETEVFEDDVALISEADICADLHMHSTWSDGAYAIEEMVDSARSRGYSHMAITDHSQSLVVANGLNKDQLKRQRERIDRLNQVYNDFTILAGIEMDILADGHLDYDNDVLAEMDFVIASIHSAFNQSRSQIMDRLKSAIANPYVHLIAHPTGRIIGRRGGYDVDVAQLIELAKDSGTALELNANPNRLDLSAKWLQKAQSAGVPLAINTDAHDTAGLDYMAIGTSAAKKGWVRPESVINTWPLPKLRQFLQTTSA